MNAPVSARERAATRHAALVEGPGAAMLAGMTLGPPQVYIESDPAGFYLYRSPDGRRRARVDGPYKTPRAALTALAALTAVLATQVSA
jgi:hypothetical protein